MSGRTREINLQLNQILDSLSITLAFWLSHSLRYEGYYVVKSISWLEGFSLFQKMPQTPGFRNFIWLMFIVVPFAPILEAMSEEHRSEIKVVDRIGISTQPIDDLVQSFSRYNVERVLIAAGHVRFNKVEEAIKACETQGVEAWLAADFIQTSIARPDFDVVERRPMLVFRSMPSASRALILKDVVDQVGALLPLVLSVPFLGGCFYRNQDRFSRACNFCSRARWALRRAVSNVQVSEDGARRGGESVGSRGWERNEWSRI